MARLGASMELNQALLGAFRSGALIGLVLGPLARRLPLPMGQRLGLLLVLLYGTGSVINGIEGYAFSTLSLPEQAHMLLATAASQAGLAVLLAVLFRPEEMTFSLGRVPREATAGGSRTSMLWRLVLAGLLFVPVFWFSGVLAFAVVGAHYQDPSLGLVVPGFEVVLLVEAVRGLLFVLAVYPLIAYWDVA